MDRQQSARSSSWQPYIWPTGMTAVAAGLGEDLQPSGFPAALRGSCAADQVRTKSLRLQELRGRISLTEKSGRAGLRAQVRMTAREGWS